MSQDCFFCKLIAGDVPSWIVYEDADHVAFLTPFPNTPGFTVVVTREHQQSDVLALPNDRFTKFILIAKEISVKLNAALGTNRTGLVIEGMGIDHAHIKLIPMHGIPDGPWQPVLSSQHDFFPTYQGFLTTNDGPRMSDAELTNLQTKIRRVLS
jgi:histidine triad (HIT) family protein